MDQVKRAMITGISGQDGSYLAELLMAHGYEVHGMVRGRGGPRLDDIERLCPGIRFVEGDLLDQSSLIAALEIVRPTEVYNLAALSSVALSFKQPVVTGEITGMGVTRLLEAVRTVDPAIRFCQASSSEVYGVATETPQTETTAHRPRSPYGSAKAYGHSLTINYRESYGMFACNAILFNHESPRRGREFVTRKITRGAARIALGLDTQLALGNLDQERDWGFAGDYVDAMYRMLRHDTPGDYVIATGTTHSVRDFCRDAFVRVGLDYTEYVVTDPQFFRPVESDPLVGDPSKAAAVLGWTPTMPFSEIVGSMVDADLAEARTEQERTEAGAGFAPATSTIIRS